VRNNADKKHGLKLNFSGSQGNFFSTWNYTTKDGKEYLESECHLDLNAPQTQEASQARIAEIGRNDKRGKKRKRRRQPRISIYEVSQVAVQKGIKSTLENCYPLLINRRKKSKLIWPSLSPTAATKQNKRLYGSDGKFFFFRFIFIFFYALFQDTNIIYNMVCLSSTLINYLQDQKT